MKYKFFKDVKTIEELKKQYKTLAFKYHPDRGGSTEDMQRINAEYDELLKVVGNVHETADGKTYTKERKTDVPDRFREIINAIIGFNCKIELCGSWIWVFNAFAYRQQLKDLGFFWCSGKRHGRGRKIPRRANTTSLLKKSVVCTARKLSKKKRRTSKRKSPHKEDSMIELNLKTANKSQEMIKAYLQENASEELADKINNGVRIEVDGKQLINRKDLNGFWKYAIKKAGKEEYVDNDTVYGWAMHYFEEDEIRGTLYNEDGTEYKPIPAPVKKSIAPTYTPPAPKPKPQMSIFDDLLSTSKTEKAAPMPETEVIEPTPKPEKPKGSPMYQTYQELTNKYPDCVVFLRVGDFYEILGERAITIARELDMTLTSRDVGPTERIPMMGVPYHAIDPYVAKLIGRNYKVAIVEDLKDIHFVTPKIEEMNVDKDTGEILSEETACDAEEEDEFEEFDKSAFDVEALAILDELFGEEIILR